VGRWSDAVRPHWQPVEPDAAAEYLLFQTLVGAWPIDAERLTAYLMKAAREAKLRTSWTDPDAAYESALGEVAAAALDDPAVRADVEAFVGLVRRPGRINALAQTLLKLTTPGVPDLYQGTELWTLSLVDPDNRRPVDFAVREQLLGEVDRCTPVELAGLLDDPDDPGRPKLALVAGALAVRSRRPAAFGADGAYLPLLAEGPAADHVVAFLRGDEVAVVVPRLPLRLGAQGGWADTAIELPEGRWSNALDGGRSHGGGRVALADVLGSFPVALLERES
jgi:(1->4)-alpha-D-glucan 1-alpha-D-glucosylmutase